LIIWSVPIIALLFLIQTIYKNWNKKQQEILLKILLVIPTIIISYHFTRVVEPLIIALFTGFVIGTWSVIPSCGALIILVSVFTICFYKSKNK